MRQKTKGSKALAIILTFALVLSVNVPMVAWGEDGTAAPGDLVVDQTTTPDKDTNEVKDAEGEPQPVAPQAPKAPDAVRDTQAASTPAEGALVDETSVAQIGDIAYSSLAEAVMQAQPDDTIALLADTQIDATLVLDKAITIDGAGYAVQADGLNPAINITTNEAVALSNLTVNGAVRGIWLSATSAQTTLTTCTLNVSERGIHMPTGTYSGVNLVLNATAINNTLVSDYDTDVVLNQQSRGISLWNIKNSAVTLRNGSSLNGFSYSINVSGDADSQSGVADTAGLVVTVEGSTIRGWTGMNVWGSLGTYNVVNSTIKGVNNSSGGSNSFAALVFNDDIYDQFENAHAENNALNISNSTITNYQGGSNVEELLRIDCGITKLTLSGTVNFADTSGHIATALDIAKMKDPFSFLRDSVVVEQGATINCTTVDGGDLPFAPSYIARYYWDNDSGGYDECYVANIADVFESKSGYTLCSGEYLDLVADATLSDDAKVALASGESFTFNRKTFNVSGGTVVLPEGVAVKTDAANNGLFKAAEGCRLIESVENNVYIYTSEKAVAQIGETAYGTLAEAIDAAQDGETVKLLRDITVSGPGDGAASVNNAVRYSGGKSITVDFDGYTLTSNTANAAFVVVGGDTEQSTVILKNGTVVAGPNAYCTILTGAGSNGTAAVVNAENMTLENSRAYGNNVKALVGSAINLKSCSVTSTGGGGGSEAAGGTINVTDCTFNQSGQYDHNSGNFAVSGGGTVNVNSGTFASGYYSLYVFNSGGTINVCGGTFSAASGTVLKADNSTTDTPSAINVSGGMFTGGYAIGDKSTLSLTGGTFTADPSVYVAEGYVSVSSDSKYAVQKAVAKSGSAYYATLQDALNSVESGAAVTLVGESTTNASLVESKAVAIDGGGYRISGTLTGSNLGNVSIKNATFATAPNLTLAASSTATFTSCVFDKANGLSQKNAAATVTGGALAFRNCSFVGAEGSDQSVGIQTWNAESVEVSGCSFTGYTGTPVTLSGSKGPLSVINNVITGWGTAAGTSDYLQGRAMRLDMQNAAAGSKVVVTGNKMVNDSFDTQKSESFIKLTGPNVTAADVAITNNYWNGLDPNTVTAITNGETGDTNRVSIAEYAGSGTLTLYPYYQDAAMTTLVISEAEQKAEAEVISGALGEVKDAESAKAAANAMASASQETKDALVKDPEAVANIAKAEDTLVNDVGSTVGATTVTGSAGSTATVTGAALTAAALGSTEKLSAQLSVEESQLPADKQMPENAAKSVALDIELHVVNESGEKVAESVQPAAPLTLKLKVAAGIDPQKLVVYSFHGANAQPEMYSEALGNLTVAYDTDGYYATLTLSKLSYVVMAEDSGTFEVSIYKPSADPSTWTTPAAPSVDQVFAGWYTDSTCVTAYTATTGKAYAKFVPLSSIITFKGGSLRMDGDASTATNLRFGYTITMPEGLSFVDVGWTASGVNGQGEPWTGTARATNKVVSDTGIIETNLLLVNVKSTYYTQMWSSTMEVTYQTSDGTSVTAVASTVDQRSIQNVATYITASNTATAVEKEYAQKILSAITPG